MASTRLTTKIKQQIISKAEGLFDKRITKAQGELRLDFWDDVTQQVYDEYYYQYSTLDVPDGWMIKIKQIDIKMNDTYTFNQRLNKSYVVLNIEGLISTESLVIKEEQVSDVLKKEHNKYIGKIESKRNECNEFVAHLKTVLGNCNTLTQFLKVWPQGEHLLEGLDLEPTNPRRKKKEIEVSEEAISKLNTGLLKQNMLNS